MMKDATAAECTRECVKKGSDFALVSGGKVYTLGNKGDLYCFDARKGDVLWTRNLEKDYGVQEFAFNASPLIEGDLLVVCIGSHPRPH